jgi:hypothetical protein
MSELPWPLIRWGGLGILALIAFALYFNLWLDLNHRAAHWLQDALSAKSNIDVAKAKRGEIRRNLLSIAEKYATHERDVVNFSNQPNQIKNAILSSLPSKYPDLKADKTYNRLLEMLFDVESDVQSKSEYYNEMAKDYNSHISTPMSGLFLGRKHVALEYLNEV